MRVLFLVTIFYAISLSSVVTLKEINKYPTSYTKDFFIYLFLKRNDISSIEADIAKSQASSKHYKIYNEWAKHSENKDVKYTQKCKKISSLENIEDVNCLATAFSTQRIFKYINNKKILLKLYQKLQTKYPKKSNIIYPLIKRNFQKELLKKQNIQLFLDIFNSINLATKKKYFNITLGYDNIKQLSKYKYKFSKMIKTTITSLSLNRLQKSFLHINMDAKFLAKSNFFLGINSLRHSNTKLAIYYFLLSYKKSDNIEHKNKSLFWLYQSTKNKKYLYTLSKSYFVDIYSIYALSKLGITPSVISKIQINKNIKKPLFDINNPFAYQKYKEDIKELTGANDSVFLDKRLLHTSTLPFLIKKYNKFFKFKKSFYFIPKYIQYLDTSIEKKAMILAIARQESNFIPSSISSSFAVGVMQIMPFVSEEIAQKSGFIYTPWNMFDAKTSVKFALFHLKGLKRHLKHPLFIAYGYSNGMGFTKRMLKKDYFNRANKFEPYLSMELIPNDQARKYGKRVLANYIIYMNLLGKKVDINTLVDKINKTRLITQK